MQKLRNIISKAGKTTRVLLLPDGTRVLVLPHGGRVLGLFTPRHDENFYWTHPALNSIKTARAFYASDAWHNSGGDRTWIAPEVDVFLPEFPRLDKFWQPRSLDPGRYRIVSSGAGFKLENKLTIRLSRLGTNLRLKITKSFGAACNPLRHERGLDLRTIEYAGYTQHTSLEISGPKRASKVRVGLWNLIQMPHGGDLLMPTFSRNKPLHIFSTIGRIPASDILVGERLVRYRMRQKGEHKISLRAATITGRVGYLYREGRYWSLVIRNFGVNPSGEYVDVPWKDPTWQGFAVQACNVNSTLGAFSELEYHTPGIGHGTGSMRCDDTSQVWAFRGSRSHIMRIARLLVTGREFSL